MEIGIFGGSFNPPHLAHLIVAEVAREQFDLDAVWWVPSYQPPHKANTDLAPARHRLAMTQRATKDQPTFRVLDVEIQRGGASYTVDTIRALQEAHPDTRFALIIGSDSLRTFGSWRRPQEITRRVPLLVYRRSGAMLPTSAPRFGGRIHFADAPILEISSTEIRARCRESRSVRYLVPDAVRAYIKEHELYTD